MIKGSTLKRILIIFGVIFIALTMTACESIPPSEPLSEVAKKDSKPENCWTCQIFAHVYNATAVISDDLFPVLSKYALSFAALAFAFWILFLFVKTFFVFREPNYKDFWTSFANRFSKLIIVSIILSSFDIFKEFMSKTVGIAMLFGLEIAKLPLETYTPEQGFPTLSFVDAAGLPATVGASLAQLVYYFTVEMNLLRLLGLAMVSAPLWSVIILGLFVTALAFFLMLFLPLYLLDAILRLLFIIMIFPFLLVFWIFPATQSWLTKNAISTFIEAFGLAIIISIYATLFVEVVKTYLDNAGMAYLYKSEMLVMTPDQLIEMQSLSLGFISSFFLFYYMYKMAGKLTNIAGALSGSKSATVGSAIAGTLKNLARACVAAAVALVAPGVAAKAAGQVAKDEMNKSLKAAAKSAASAGGGK